MADTDLKELLVSIKKELSRLKDQIEVVASKMSGMELFQLSTTSQLRQLRDQQSVMNEKLDSHTEALITIEGKIGGYKDAYLMNKDHIERLDTRLDTVEDELAIEPPEKLKVPHFPD